jgi:hypothetical protein
MTEKKVMKGNNVISTFIAMFVVALVGGNYLGAMGTILTMVVVMVGMLGSATSVVKGKGKKW